MLCSVMSLSREFTGISRGRSVTTAVIVLLPMLSACIGPHVQPAPAPQSQAGIVEPAIVR
ncbi:MAG: hypothetical protein U0361_13470 [Nitrospiraceae bacterium]